MTSDHQQGTTMNLEHSFPSGTVAQRGIALIVGLIILAVLSLIGVAAFSITTQEERMAGNSRDHMRAFQMAEAALRNCEDYLRNNGGSALFLSPVGTYVGMYPGPANSSSPTMAEQHAMDEAWWRATSPANTLQVTVPNSDTPYKPSCIAESLTLFPNIGYTVGNPLNSANATNIAHITAHGYGLNANTVVRLDSYFSM
jgi:Tfp pilus assembly protein PilX